MFKLDTEAESKPFKWPVKFSIILPPGSTQKQQIRFIFKRFDRAELIELDKNRPAVTGEQQTAEIIEDDLNYLEQFVEGWEGVEIDGSQEFNRDNLRKLLIKVPSIHLKIRQAFFEASTGAYELKN